MGVAGGATGPELYTVDRPGLGRLSTMARPDGFGALDHVLAALRAAGVDVLVSLLAEDEAEEEGLADEAERAKAHGLTFYHLPTQDHHAPDRDATVALAKTLHRHLARGDSVVVHCWAGIGRSSTVAAATLLLEGCEPGAAWRLISAARGYEVPDQQSQRDLIDELWS
jgi:protein-tyrosine phosphatase